MFEANKMVAKNILEEKKKRKTPHVPNDFIRRVVYSHSAYGATHEDICIIVGINKNTLYKYYKKELDDGAATAKSTIAERLYKVAVGRPAVIDPETKEVIDPGTKPNLGALIFLAKVRLGWKEHHVLEQKVDMQSSGVQIYLPDNGMRSNDGKEV